MTPLVTCVGMKSIMVTVDTYGLPPAATQEIARWATAALLHAALDETTPAESGLALGLGRAVSTRPPCFTTAANGTGERLASSGGAVTEWPMPSHRCSVHVVAFANTH
jgi:hypothetical protein